MLMLTIPVSDLHEHDAMWRRGDRAIVFAELREAAMPKSACVAPHVSFLEHTVYNGLDATAFFILLAGAPASLPVLCGNRAPASARAILFGTIDSSNRAVIIRPGESGQ
jgi:hypothetical protein